MVGRTLKRSVVAIMCATVVVGIAICGNAQILKKVTNPYTAKRLEEMRHPEKASAWRLSSVSKDSFQRVMPQVQAQTADAIAKYVPVRPQMNAAASLNFPGLFAAPYVAATAATDNSPVYASGNADFDGDNSSDIVTVQMDGTLNLLANDGKGGFTLTYSNSSAVAFNPQVVYLEVADLNGDGHLDVVAMDASNSAFVVFLNNGDGTFADATSVSVSPATGAIFMNGGTLAVADVNGDGIPDVVTIANVQNGSYPSYTTVFSQQTFLGNGDGTFATPAASTDSSIPGFLYVQYGQGVVVADLNGDQVPDLVTEYYDQMNYWITIVGSLGTGDGTFGAISEGTSVRGMQQINSALQIADINRDGKQDAIFVFGDANAYVALGNGDGTFQSPNSVLQNIPAAYFIRLGDFDQDAYPDLLVYSMGAVAVYPGRGDGTFNPNPVGQYGANSGAQQATPADFDGDGKLDFAVTDASYGTVSLYRGLGDGTFVAQRAVAPVNASSTLPNSSESANNYVVVATGDANADGKTDVLAEDYTNPYYTPYGEYPDVNVGISDGKGGFTFSTALKGLDLAVAEGYALAPIVADFNHDGRFDLVLETGSGMAIALGKADGTLDSLKPISFPVPVSGCAFSSVDVADINNDGNLDILVGYYGESSSCIGNSTPAGYFVLLGDGHGGFRAKFTEYYYLVHQAKLVDLNGDGNLDMVVDIGYSTGHLICASCPTPILALRGNGDGTFNVDELQIALAGWRIAGVIPGDFDGDGIQDLTLLSWIQIDPSIGMVPHTSGIVLLKGKGDFTFEEPVLIAADTFASQAQYADLNGDGLPELVFSMDTSHQDVPTYFGLSVLQNLGGGAFAEPVNYLEPQGDVKTFVGDFNGDGARDILVAPKGNNGLPSVVFLNQGGSTLSLTITPTTVQQGDSVVIRATLSALPGIPAATGEVQFSSNGTSIGTADLSDGVVAELTTSELPVGTNTVTATYSGDTNHNPSTSAPVSVTVTALAPSFTVSASPQSLTLSTGQNGTVALNFTANATFDGSITVACSNLPDGASCAATPSSLALSGGQSGTINVVISAGASTQALSRPFTLGWVAMSTLALLPGMLLIWPSRRRRMTRAIATSVIMLLCLTMSSALVGCGDGKKSTAPPTQQLVTITATADSSGTTVQQTAVISVTINH